MFVSITSMAFLKTGMANFQCYGVFFLKSICRYFAIYDGHGGREAVEFVAEHLHEVSFFLLSSLFLTVLEQNICKELKKTSDVSEAIKVAYFETDEEIGRQKINYSGIFHSFVLSFEFERFSQELQVFLV